MKTYIWLDKNINTKENQNYVKELELIYQIEVKTYENIIKAIKYLETLNFEETKIIISGQLYDEFVLIFKEKVSKINVVPKIIVFTQDKNAFIKSHSDFRNLNNKFYCLGGVVDSFDDVEKFLNNPIKPIPDVQLTFEQIKTKEQLVLPLFFKSLIDALPNEDIEKYTISLYDNYAKNNNKVKELLGPIKYIKDIPIEILSKYYARLYTIESEFYDKINKDLGLNKYDNYLRFIKILYEGVKFKSLPLSKEKILYRGAKISNNEIIKIKENMNKKIEGLPSSIVFSKSFLSFSKDESRAKYFFKKGNINNDISRVLFVLEKNVEIDYNLSTHGDISKLSVYPNENEVLFFPFSTFEIKSIKEIYIGNEKGYEIKLLYLDKYLDDIEQDKNVIKNVNKLPDSKFKEQLSKTGLIKKEKIEKLDTQTVYNSYKNYEKEVNSNKDNKIIGEISISVFDIKERTQIINSFENVKELNNYKNKENDWKYENKKEIEDNIQIRINDEIKNFRYYYRFKNQGTYKIEYIFKNPLTKTNHMFFGCKNIIKLDFSNFDTSQVTNMSNMFYNCNSLKKINLANFNTENVDNMSSMFSFCNSLLNLNLSFFNTQNVTDMSYMFIDCNSLLNLDLSNFNTENVVNMSYMFSGNRKLTDLNLSNFNTQNTNSITDDMFYDCNLMKKNVITSDEKILKELVHY